MVQIYEMKICERGANIVIGSLTEIQGCLELVGLSKFERVKLVMHY